MPRLFDAKAYFPCMHSVGRLSCAVMCALAHCVCTHLCLAMAGLRPAGLQKLPTVGT